MPSEIIYAEDDICNDPVAINIACPRYKSFSLAETNLL
jgi:hypothetical protein